MPDDKVYCSVTGISLYCETQVNMWLLTFSPEGKMGYSFRKGVLVLRMRRWAEFRDKEIRRDKRMEKTETERKKKERNKFRMFMAVNHTITIF
jgi:hypothetical protein